jgi:hypothetical protein
MAAQKAPQKAATKTSPKAVATDYTAVDKKALQVSTSQAQSANALAQYINANFNKDEDKLRAAFIWEAKNLAYDVDNMFAINFNEKMEERVAKTFATRKGICTDYASIFVDISNLCGIPAYKVSGYTKQNGVADYVPHAWCVAFVNNDWYVFDPTWGAGYLRGSTFVPKLNNEYFMAKPAAMIKSHMPFDPLWECLPSPLSNSEFYYGGPQPGARKTFFNYKDSIKAWGQQTEIEQYLATARRVEANGVKNSLVYDRLVHLKKEIKYYYDSTAYAQENSKRSAEHNRDSVDIANYNAASENYNLAVKEYNEFINYRNKQFKPAREDSEIQQMVDAPDGHLADAKARLAKLKNPKPNVAPLAITLTRSIDDIQVLLDEQKDFVTRYLSKSKFSRTFMFTNLGAGGGRK